MRKIYKVLSFNNEQYGVVWSGNCGKCVENINLIAALEPRPFVCWGLQLPKYRNIITLSEIRTRSIGYNGGNEMEKMKKCNACGAEIAKSAKSCPQCGAKNKKPIFKKWWFWAIIVIIAIGAAAGSGGSDEPKPAVGANADAVSNEGGDASGGEEEKTTFGVNEPAELNNIIVTFNGVTESNGSSFNTPTDGNVFLICEFTFENNSDKEINLSTLLSFDSYVDDYAANLDLMALTESDKPQLDGTIAPGKKMNGVIGIQAPTDWSQVEIHVTPDFWGKDIAFTAGK